jgi:hypothetical protein
MAKRTVIQQARIARGIRGLLKVSRHARPFYVLQVGHPRNSLTAITGVARALDGGLRPSSTPLVTPHHTGPVKNGIKDWRMYPRPHPDSTTPPPAGYHPRTGLTGAPKMAARRASLPLEK